MKQFLFLSVVSDFFFFFYGVRFLSIFFITVVAVITLGTAAARPLPILAQVRRPCKPLEATLFSLRWSTSMIGAPSSHISFTCSIVGLICHCFCRFKAVSTGRIKANISERRFFCADREDLSTQAFCRDQCERFDLPNITETLSASEVLYQN